ncbi:hypothetical protein LCGC14_2377000 [marine sediment metagenome]|uniref:Uncharacterized protein n=1 Tax=marine sediment metagenome TaxID=412755 RepID=A0A0F9C239_9ZZZZ
MCIIKAKAKWAKDQSGYPLTPRMEIDFADIAAKRDALHEDGLEPIKVIIELPKGDLVYGIPVEWRTEE